MKQVLQDLGNGRTLVEDVPVPTAGRGQLLIRSHRSLVSAGTERMLVEFGKAGLLEKARQQPDKVRMVWDKVKTDGLLPTVEAIRSKLGQPLPMGYCNVGEVIAVGAGVKGFEVGDRVASNGRHAEVVAVPVNLCAKVPRDVSDEAAAFTVLGAIALQGIRLIQPTIGEVVVVTGLGLIGLMTVQMLRANGCRVLGLDFDQRKLELARRFGAETVDLRAGEDPVKAAMDFSRGRGVDAVIVTASTQSSELMHQAALMCRKRGRIVLVGVAGLELSRADFFEKEITFQVSCSYGPGRYDPGYEDKGLDYPIGFVRWTEQRNFEAVLDMLEARHIEVEPLVSHRFSIADAEQAYAVVGGAEESLGILLDYPQGSDLGGPVSRCVALGAAPAVAAATPSIGFIGAGNYAGAVLIPAFKATGARLRAVASANGVSSVHLGRKFGFEQASTDANALLSDPSINAVVISTRHDSHASFVLSAASQGKHVFVEKPLCLSIEELDRIEAAMRDSGLILAVGFNRRFAPHVQRMVALLAATPGPKSFVMTVNAGSIPSNHWTQDPEVGGGRILGEACHFVDLIRFLAGSPVKSYDVRAMKGAVADTATILLQFESGSTGTIHYFANGSKAFPKERLEVFSAGQVLQLDNFRVLRGFGWPGFGKLALWKQDKGQRACAAAFVEAIREGRPAPIPLPDILEVSRITIELQQALR